MSDGRGIAFFLLSKEDQNALRSPTGTTCGIQRPGVRSCRGGDGHAAGPRAGGAQEQSRDPHGGDARRVRRREAVARFRHARSHDRVHDPERRFSVPVDRGRRNDPDEHAGRRLFPGGPVPGQADDHGQGRCETRGARARGPITNTILPTGPRISSPRPRT